MRQHKSFIERFQRLFGDPRGSVSVELGIVLSLLTVMVIPTVDIGMGAYTQMQVANAAQAGAEYAAVNGWNSGNVSTAVTSATSLGGISASPAPTETCGCVTAGAVVAATCGATCSNGNTAGSFVTVNAQATYTTLFSYPGLPSPMTMTSTSTVRIQ